MSHLSLFASHRTDDILLCFVFLRALMLKFGALCRQFISDDGDSTYLCILNPYHLDMFFLVETNDTMCRMVIYFILFIYFLHKNFNPFFITSQYNDINS